MLALLYHPFKLLALLILIQSLFLPCRPGAVAHQTEDRDLAHKELHFRLLRHDLIAPLVEALNAFRKAGGSTQLEPPVGHQMHNTFCYSISLVGVKALDSDINMPA
jgi:hypothetical protein